MHKFCSCCCWLIYAINECVRSCHSWGEKFHVGIFKCYTCDKCQLLQDDSVCQALPIYAIFIVFDTVLKVHEHGCMWRGGIRNSRKIDLLLDCTIWKRNIHASTTLVSCNVKGSNKASSAVHFENMEKSTEPDSAPCMHPCIYTVFCLWWAKLWIHENNLKLPITITYKNLCIKMNFWKYWLCQMLCW